MYKYVILIHVETYSQSSRSGLRMLPTVTVSRTFCIVSSLVTRCHIKDALGWDAMLQHWVNWGFTDWNKLLSVSSNSHVKNKNWNWLVKNWQPYIFFNLSVIVNKCNSIGPAGDQRKRYMSYSLHFQLTSILKIEN